jgi:neutral ceramidase
MGRSDITVYESGMCMFGWGQPANVALGVREPLFARALVLESPAEKARIAYVCADLGFISERLRQRVMELIAESELGFADHEVMLTATHTHSGPNGYSTYIFYAVTGPGFSPPVVDGLARGIVAAIRSAVDALAPARLHFHSASIPLTERVAFNRSLAAYNLNADVMPLSAERHDEAVDREMRVLRIDDLTGRPRGLVCWFPVHGTSVHSDNVAIHPDNKGIAARRCEDRAAARFEGGERFVAIFAQEAAGDVSPNYRWDAKRGFRVGRYDDDFESAAFAGDIQARHAWDVFVDAPLRGTELTGGLKANMRYRDFSSSVVDPDFAEGREGQTTSTACLGMPFTYGTEEGPGPAFALRGLNPVLSQIVRLRRAVRRPDWRTMHGAKVPFFDIGHGASGKIIGLFPMLPPGFHRLPDKRVEYYCRVLESGALGDRPWVPQVLPAQIFRIGALAIVGIPAEPTTVSGRRMRAAALPALRRCGVERVVINGYANAYASYVTTFEEYQLQRYEGGCTLFGEWTLAAWCTEIRSVARDMANSKAGASPGVRPARLGWDGLLSAAG